MPETFAGTELMYLSGVRMTPAPQRYVTRNAALAEGKIPLPHRFCLVDGRVIEGYFYRGNSSRLVDELYGQKGSFFSVIDARCLTTGRLVPYMAINEAHVVSIEELVTLTNTADHLG